MSSSEVRFRALDRALQYYKLANLQEAQALLTVEQFEGLMLEIADAEGQIVRRSQPARYRASNRSLSTPIGQVPPVTAGIFALIWVVFLLESIQPGGSTDTTVLYLFGGTTADTFSNGQLWRLVASGFVHIGIVHILGNSLALLWLGQIAERLFGRVRFLGLYLAAGIGGSVLSVLLEGTDTISAGASGAIWGLMGAILVGSWVNRRTIGDEQGRELRRSLMGTLILNACISLVPGISLTAHLGGFITGAALAAVIPFSTTHETKSAANRVDFISKVLIAFAALLMLSWLSAH